MADGEEFGPYRLLRLLGRGGMGEVFEAYDTVQDRQVAVKRLLTHMADDEEFQKRFRRESRLAARLRNPHVIPIHTYGDVDGRLFLEMRLVEGCDLQVLLAGEQGGLAPDRAASIVNQVASALDAAHAAGLVHRDVKPSNILIDSDVGGQDFVYLADFGITRAVSGASQSITASHVVVGSLDYMAPEQFDGVAGPAADVYSLGCVLYQCLTGAPPFPAEGLPALMKAHTTLPAPLPSRTRPELGGAFDQVVARALAKDPAERHATAADLASDVRAAARSAGAPVGPNGTRPDAARPDGSGAAGYEGAGAAAHEGNGIAGHDGNGAAVAAAAVAGAAAAAAPPRLDPDPDAPARPASTPGSGSTPGNGSTPAGGPAPGNGSTPGSRSEPGTNRLSGNGSASGNGAISGNGSGPGRGSAPGAGSGPSTAVPSEEPTAAIAIGDRDRDGSRNNGAAVPAGVAAVDGPPPGGPPPSTDPGPDGRRPRRMGPLGVAVIAIVLVVGLGIGLLVGQLTRPDTTAPPPPAGSSFPATAAPAVRSVDRPIVTARIAVGNGPETVALTPDGQRAYLTTTSGPPAVAVVDTRTGRVTASVPTPGPPYYVGLSPSGDRAYVSYYDRARQEVALGILDTSRNQFVGSIPTGQRSAQGTRLTWVFGFAMSRDGTRIYVPNQEASIVSVVDTATAAPIAQIPVPATPHWVSLTPDGRKAYVTNHMPGQLTVLDTVANRVAGSIPIGPGVATHSVTVSPDGRIAEAVNYDADVLSMIDTSTDRVFATIPTGDDPQSVVFARDGAHSYIVNEDAGTVTVVDTAKRAITETIPIGPGASMVAVAPDGRTALVAAKESNQVVVLKIAA